MLDGSGKVGVVSAGASESSGFFVFVVVIAILVILFLVIKYVWMAPKQVQSTDVDEAARQDHENVYR